MWRLGPLLRRFSASASQPCGIWETCRLAIPLMATAAAGSANALADKFFLARHSSAAIQAVVPAASLAGAATCFFAATVGYVSALVAHEHGRGDLRGCRRAFAQSFYLTAMFLPAVAALYPVGAAVFRASAPSAAVAEAELDCFLWLLPSGAVNVFFGALVGYFTGRGRMVPVGVAGVLGAIVNLALDPVLIFGLGPVPSLGIVGSAIATLSASCASALFLALAALREFRSVPCPGAMRFDAAAMLRLVRLGAPHGAMMLFCTIAFAAFVLATGRCGAVELAASNVAFGFNGIYFMAVSAFRDVCTALVGRSSGKGDYAEMRRSARSALALSWTFAFVFSLLALGGAGIAAAAFADGTSALDSGRFASALFAVFAAMCARTFAEGFSETFAAALRGVGDTSYILRVRVVCSLFVWMPLVAVALFATPRPTAAALWVTMPVYLAVSGLFLRHRWLASFRKCPVF